MKISPSGKSSKLAVLLLAAGVVAISIVWIARTYLAERVGWKVSLRNFQLATRLDPENSEYQLRLGRLYQYDPAEMDPDQAMTHLARAAELSPYDPQAWLDLGAAFEFQANTAQAEACLRRADFLAPDLPPIQWAIGNFFLLHGNIGIFVEKKSWYLLVHSQCRELLPDGRCGIYETRPQICRDYSTVDCEYDDDWTYDLYFETPEQIEEYAEARFPARGNKIRSPRPGLPIFKARPK